MLTVDQTAEPEPIPPAAPPRSVAGTVWRALVAVLVCLGAVAGGAWVGAKALPIDGRLLEAPAAVPGLVVIGLGLGMLRARPWFAVVPGLAADAAVCAGAGVIHDRLISAGRLHLDTLGARLLAGGFALALLISVLGIVVAAVSGHRHPREDGSTAPA
ncbi:hypothetical protein [Streptacidiphilus sp. EB129]|uniref:hypothetical protein n=1 Tax=Streptacidiphilus sp. EB129 TaxID=3156262 RepID=UPI00351551FC